MATQAPVRAGRTGRTGSADRTDPAPEHSCSIQRTLEVVGDRWTLLILRDLFRGVRRFGQLQEDLAIARNLLSDRLSRLVDAGIVERVPYQDRPVRHDYVLTGRGRDLSPSLLALMRWGDRWCTDGEPPTVLVHAACGTALEQVTRCRKCDELVTPAQIRSRPGRP
ncbi:MAG TPA: transcriptional regulator [Acidimicrobiaceae bacterium]|nr:transcriptional regulator [Acidimicrobiaceae bacterium]HCB37377.1 transcriptional regulator [Acidimicrobiaceae bacterium]